MSHPTKQHLSDHTLHLPEETNVNNSSSSVLLLQKKTSSSSDLDPFERKKQAALAKAEAKLEKAQRLYQSAQQSLEQNISEFLRVTTIPGILHESKTTNIAYEKRIRTLQETKKELEKKITTYQADILRIQSGDIPQHYSSSKDILNNIKNKVTGGNSKPNSSNDVSATTSHESSVVESDLPATSMNTTNQNLLSINQNNSNTLEMTRSSPSNSISNDAGKRQSAKTTTFEHDHRILEEHFYDRKHDIFLPGMQIDQFSIDLFLKFFLADLSAIHDTDRSPSTKRRLT